MESRKVIMEELLMLHEQYPERFMQFYNSIYMLIHDLPEGKSLLIADHCKPKSIELFKKISSILIADYNAKKDCMEDYYEFSIDGESIRHYSKFRSQQKKSVTTQASSM